ncbi:peptide ABC transporter permease [Acrocarpospora phusangensis]|uniref:Peptide ABC transporter permease n=1 Tax=Acrocarpospora phusangensis TaxID=1070424 RepID=A0A919Q7J0_9ACTN|nr:ABC transporter permease [Acrocarpospora phusangensis]GIH23408.1 peptide ABC transporter permease [Acrocarpospora phusangensis]
MARFLVRRIATAIVVLLLMVAAIFALQQLSPADPARAMVGDRATPEALAHAREELGLDRPFVVRLAGYLGDVARGDFQISYRTKQPVASDIASTLPATLQLLVAAAVFAVLAGLILGLLTAHRGLLVSAVRALMLTGASIPIFLLGLVFLLVFYDALGWLPGSGFGTGPDGPTGFLTIDTLLHGRFDEFWNSLTHLIMPAIALGAGPSVGIGRAFGSALTTVLNADYVKTARLKGLSWTGIVFKHALRNCLNSALAMTGLMFGVMLGTVAIVEKIFAWPGVGNYLSISIRTTDVPAITAVAVVFGAIFITLNAAVDVLQTFADPRISLDATSK